MSQILTLTATITRAELALTDLALESPGNYALTLVAPGGRAWNRQLIGSRYVHGDTKVSAVLRHGQAVLGVRCYGLAAAALEARTADMVNAFSQGNYVLTVSINGVQHQWKCWEADLDVAAGEWDKFALAQHQMEYRMQIPRHPVALLGAL